jgi:DNA (cytosine-5)-methyltransferase 1
MIGQPLIIDSFAGGGGASTGIEMTLGRSPDIAINHNEAALALHAANHPETLHLSENIFKVDPLDHVKGQHVGLAWFSPDCKHFSKAKGGKPVERNIRDLAWIIVLWAERAKPDVIIMENVEEWKDWGPLLDTDKGLMPCPDRRGQTFQKWCKAMRRAGYKLQHRELRACDYGAPTIRKRLFVVARRDGKPIVWPTPTHGAPNSHDVISGKKLPWRTAAEIIDWSLPCPSIFDTSAAIMTKHKLRAVRPLADATMDRVARGLKRYVLDAKRPFIVNLTHGARLEDVGQPFNTITGANRGEKAVIAPILTAAQHGGSNRTVEDPHHTITASKKDQNSVIIPNLMSMKGSDRRDSGVDAPHPTVLAGGGHSALVSSFIARQFGESVGHGVNEPSATVTAGGGGKSAVVSAFMAQHNNDSRRIGGVNPGRPMDEPVSTVTQTGSQQGIVAAKLVAPFMQAYYGTGDGGEEDQPCRTITTKDRHGHVEAEISAPPFTDDQHGRAREVADFMRSHGFWDEREFVTLTIAGEPFVIVDIGMRMLTPRELYSAQGFPADYKIDQDVDGNAFSKSVQVSCVGNSVSPPVAAALVAANCSDLIEYREAAE